MERLFTTSDGRIIDLSYVMMINPTVLQITLTSGWIEPISNDEIDKFIEAHENFKNVIQHPNNAIYQK